MCENIASLQVLIVMIGRDGIEQDSAVGPSGDFGRGVQSFGTVRGRGKGTSTEDGKWWGDLAGTGDSRHLVPGNLASLKPRNTGRQRLVNLMGKGKRIFFFQVPGKFF